MRELTLEASASAQNDELLRLQAEAFRRQIPFMYVVLSANVIGLAATHVDVAPMWLAVLAPALLVAISIVRMMVWRRNRDKKLSALRARKMMRATHISSAIVGGAFVIWALALAPLGNAYQQTHVAVFMGLMSFVCAMCMLHAGRIAFTLVTIEVIPFTLYYVSTGNPVLITIAINVFLVGAAGLIVQRSYAKDFSALAQSRAEARQLQEEMAALADTDSLTQLDNRRRFFRQLGNHVAYANSEGKRLSIALIDLDGFKQVNDVHGHRAGDRILRAVAERLRQSVCEGSMIARLGGDEFAVVFGEEMSDAELRAAGLVICLAMREPFPLRESHAQIGASIGIASVPESAKSAEELYECADYALYQAKNEAPGTTQLFTSTHRGNIRRMSIIEQALRSPQIGKDLTLVFQPIFELGSNRIAAFEALARWQHKELGPISPDVFIRAAERSGTISRLSSLLYLQALDAMQDWPEDILLSFNLSAHDLLGPTAIEELSKATRARGISASRIQFEVTETGLIADFERAQRSLAILKQQGFQIALDDFGVGYSSLSYLQKLTIDRIKIDKSFIKTLDVDQSGKNIVRTIIDLSDSLGIGCVIEGIESEAQLAAVQKMGCTYGQGYLFGLPVDAEELPNLCSNATRAPRRLALVQR